MTLDADKECLSLVAAQMDVTELFVLLESKEIHIVEDVKALIHENLNTSRESFLLCALADYCMSTRSNRCLEILVGVREPHDKYLFDKISEGLRLDASKESALMLLDHLVRRQPSWLHKIATHKILNTLLQTLKNDSNVPTLMNGLLIIANLLPIIPSLVAPHINDIFEIFTRLCAWSTKKPGNVPEVYFLHLRVALYTLFHRLYAMYPCNLLAFLRYHYGRDHSRENINVFNETIKPMLERVRLHPLLVTASKETELTMARWKNLEPHDIIVHCGKLSLDEIQVGEMDSGQWTTLDQKQQRCESINVPVEPGSLMAESMDQRQLQLGVSNQDTSSEEQQTDSSANKSSCEGSQEGEVGVVVVGAVVQAEEATEEGGKQCQFLSTTDTLTTNCSALEGQDQQEFDQQPLVKEDCDSELSVASNDASSVLIERLVHGINRLRFFSHCGHPPEIPIEWLRKTPLLRKSHSWPDLNLNQMSTNSREGLCKYNTPSPPSLVATSNSQTDFSREHSPDKVKIGLQQEPILEECPVQQPLSVSETTNTTNSGSSIILQNASQTSSTLSMDRPKFALLSPVEVLDRHLQLGSEIYLKELRSMSLASMKETDWTHFGGPPPADELNILRGQISLLHMQLLFERHRCEVHAERNRRLLGKAKKARALEEQNLAMKEQLGLQEKELKDSLEQSQRLQVALDKKNADIDYKDLHNNLRKQMLENHKLESGAKETNRALQSATEECDKLTSQLDESRGSLLDAQLELKDLRLKAESYILLEQRNKQYAGKLLALQELYSRYVQREAAKAGMADCAFELQQFKESAIYETEELKHTIRSQSRDLETGKARLDCLEEQLSAKDSVIAELRASGESVKSANAEVLRSKDLHIKTLQRMCYRQEEHIMELNHKICKEETTARPVSSSLSSQDDPSLNYHSHWHPAQTEFNYGLSLPPEPINQAAAAATPQIYPAEINNHVNNVESNSNI